MSASPFRMGSSSPGPRQCRSVVTVLFGQRQSSRGAFGGAAMALVAVLLLAAVVAPSSPARASATTPQISAANGEFSCALLADGTVRCWGRNGAGNLGDGTTTDRLNPVEVLASGSAQGSNLLGGVTQISAGGFHACAMLGDETVRCWGFNATVNEGALGDGTATNRTNPVQVLASGSTQGTDVLGGVVQISAGTRHTCALLNDQSLRCWGRNSEGQLGDGTTTNRRNPVQVLTGVQQVSSGVEHTCALLTGGSVRCWGRNGDGRLGDGTTTDRQSPVEVLASGSTQGTDVLGGVTRISAGSSHTCALLSDQTVRCWGANGFFGDEGALGDGTATSRSNPVKVLMSGTDQNANVLSGVTQVSAGGYHSCALLSGGESWCWGANSSGQLGDGTTTDRRNPVRVMAEVRQVSAGGYHTCALLTDDTIRCSGYNASGALGDGTRSDRSTPVPVLASGTAAASPVTFRVAPEIAARPVATPTLTATCAGSVRSGSEVTCTVTGGDPGIDILWRAAFNPVIAEAGVTLDATGSGEFSFTVPAAAVGQVITVELVDWAAPVSLGVVGGTVPSSVPSGGGPVPVWPALLLALAGGLALRRGSRSRRSAWHAG